MKNLKINRTIPVILVVLSLVFFCSCSDDDKIEDTTEQVVTDEEKASLLFMLEEEKLARDTYIYLNNVWTINQFDKIKDSEQTHMNAIENLLIQNNIAYTVLPIGEFENQDLQNYYDQFKIDGAISKANAYQIGATIEDLDIVDLQDYIKVTKNSSLITVFENLECGSRNHLRSFVKGIVNTGDSYMPQFLTQEAFNLIINSSNEQCN
jgi:hypothetical protein